MKFTVTFKSPDGVSDSIRRAANESVECPSVVHDDCTCEYDIEEVEDKLKAFIGPWVEFGEYLDVEFDTEAGTATVLKRS